MDYVERLIANGLTVRFQSNETNLSPSVPFLMSGQSLSALSFSTANDARKQIGTPDAADCKLARTVLIRPYYEFTVGYTAQSPCNDPTFAFHRHVRATANWLLRLALLRFFLHQPFSQENKPEKLCPLRHDVSHDLSPPPFRIHFQIEQCPPRSGKHQKNGQRMIPNSLEQGASETSARLSALR